MNYQGLIPYLLSGVKQLDRENHELKQQISELKGFDVLSLQQDNTQLKEKVASLETQLTGLITTLKKKFII
jgi:cell division septum initiation protein DivIVA